MAEPTSMPTRKMTAVAITGAVTTIIVTLSKDAFGYEMSAELASAITAILTFLAGYLTPNAQEPTV